MCLYSVRSCSELHRYLSIAQPIIDEAYSTFASVTIVCFVAVLTIKNVGSVHSFIGWISKPSYACLHLYTGCINFYLSSIGAALVSLIVNSNINGLLLNNVNELATLNKTELFCYFISQGKKFL